MILAGDVGGTHTRLGLFRSGVQGELEPAGPFAEFPSPGYPGLADVALEFLGAARGQRGSIEAACFGIPGPVVLNRAKAPNLPWPELDGAEIAERLGLAPERAILVNDLAAAAAGLDRLGPGQLEELQAGVGASAQGSRALVSAGTGLGIALQGRAADGGWTTLPTEGGHVDFAPRDEEEWQLCRYVAVLPPVAAKSAGHVSVERLVSGPGLANLYSFLRDARGLPAEPEVERALAEHAAGTPGADPSAAIAAAGAAGHPTCDRALARFVSIYGAVAGNVALVAGATAGIYLGGGVAPKLRARLGDGTFLTAFRAKGRFAGYLERIPVRIVLEERAGLLGAAEIARALVPDDPTSRSVLRHP
ncbi:MAG TPA: glucokinase [Thermoanaerobaculia bacterium]|nr:glucokinase [Thermoanaerobaculia bacterium]